MKKRSIVPVVYILFLMLPIYWLITMSFKTTNEILEGFSLFPETFTLDAYKTIFTDPSWYWGYINSIIDVSLNTILSLMVALPAAYAVSRYRFLGDKTLFFWLLTNRMAPIAVFALPFFQLYSAVGLFFLLCKGVFDFHIGTHTKSNDDGNANYISDNFFCFGQVHNCLS